MDFGWLLNRIIHLEYYKNFYTNLSNFVDSKFLLFLFNLYTLKLILNANYKVIKPIFQKNYYLTFNILFKSLFCLSV